LPHFLILIGKNRCNLHTGLYISIPLYFVLLFCVAYWGYIRTKYLKTKSDELSAHYLGGRSFGPLLSAGTMFASQFSGYTIVGIPNEAYKTGWVSLRWILTGISVIFGYAGTAYRLRKCSLLRNHQSPVDFITDRFRSQILPKCTSNGYQGTVQFNF
jgi:sodium/proline symporter